MNTINLTELLRWIFTISGAVIAILEPTLPYLIICTLSILSDCYTAWSLSRRVRKAHPDKVSKDGHKFKSHNFGKVILTILKAYTLIILAFLIQQYITDSWSIDLTKVVAGAI